MLHFSKKVLVLAFFLGASLYGAESIPLYNNYLNMTYMSAKNSMMANSSTATAKGYSAMLSNPAGLSTNYNAAIYLKVLAGSVENSEETTIRSFDTSQQNTVGVLYDSFALEAKNNDYILGGGAYGYETKYGLFSIGLSYLKDVTDLTQKDSDPTQRIEFATGDYLTYGVMWQKSFVSEENFYAVYLGYSHKNSGKYAGENTSALVVVSPSKFNFGIGLEAKVLDTSLLFTYDMSQEYWQSTDELLDGTALGLKWMINQKFAIAGGMNQQTFSGSILKNIESLGLGIEFGFLDFHTETAFTQRTVNDFSGVYATEIALHLDVAYTF